MQFILIVVTIAAAILFDVRPSGAYQGPWCAVENIGQDVRYDCSMRTLEHPISCRGIFRAFSATWVSTTIVRQPI